MLTDVRMKRDVMTGSFPFMEIFRVSRASRQSGRCSATGPRRY